MNAKPVMFVRASTLTSYRQVAQELGLDYTPLLQQVGLDASILDDPNKSISREAYLQLLVLSAAATGLTDFGTRLAIARGIPDFGVVSLFMRESENAEAAIKVMNSYLSLHSDGSSFSIDKRFEDPFIIFETRTSSPEQLYQVTQMVLVGLVRNLRWLVGDSFKPKWVCFSHPSSLTSTAAQRFFDCPITSGDISSGLVVSRDDLRRPITTSPSFMRREALRHLQMTVPAPKESFAAKVGRVVRHQLTEGECATDTVSAEFKIDRRTLNRRLRLEGQTFSSILQNVRIELVEASLQNSDGTLTDLSAITGFQSLSAFCRWFQTSFGCTASERRKHAVPRRWNVGLQSASNID